MSDDGVSTPSGIVPPHLQWQWRRLHQHLNRAGELCADATLLSTVAEVRPMVTAALTELIDASFWGLQLERDYRNTPLEGIEP